jgi:hypothetical protein
MSAIIIPKSVFIVHKRSGKFVSMEYQEFCGIPPMEPNTAVDNLFSIEQTPRQIAV